MSTEEEMVAILRSLGMASPIHEPLRTEVLREWATALLASDWYAARIREAEQRGAARALREAAELLGDGGNQPWVDMDVPVWLDYRADRIEQGDQS